MGNKALIEFLQGTNLVSLNIAEEIANRFRQLSIIKNEFLLTEGKICDTYFFLEKGFMRAFACFVHGDTKLIFKFE